MSEARDRSSDFPALGVGLGLRAPHYTHILEQRPPIAWFEAISENYMGIAGGGPGRPLKVLETIRRDYPIALHGVSMSIASMDALNLDYLQKLSALIDVIQPAWVSDHLCWTGVDGENLHDLLPVPYSAEMLAHLVPRIAQVQERLGRRMLFENVSSYLSFADSEMTEWEFLSELATRADCGLLLDINNIYVSATNHGFDPMQFIDGIPIHCVGQMHLAGHSSNGAMLIDTHDHPVCDEVWDLYRHAIRRFGPVSTLVEWDAEIPSFSRLEAEAARAAKILTSDAQKGVSHGGAALGAQAQRA